MELPGVPNDTRPEAERQLIEGLRKLGPEGRLAQTCALCAAVNEMARAGIRLREGQLSEVELRLRLAELRYGRAVVARVEEYLAKAAR